MERTVVSRVGEGESADPGISPTLVIQSVDRNLRLQFVG